MGFAHRAPHPTAQLVELGQAEALRVLDQDRPRIGDVDPDLDHRRGHEHTQLTAAKTLHDGIFVPSEHAAVDHPDPVFGQQLAHRRGRGFDIGSVDGLAGLDQRAHHVRLVAREHPVDQGSPSLSQGPPAWKYARDRRHPTRRKLIDHRGIELAEGRERQAARDRGRGHDQEVWGGPLLTQRPTLLDPKAVLLVDDHQRQAGELDLVDQQGMGADEQIDLPRAEQSQQAGPLSPGRGSGQQGDADTRELAPRLHAPQVLLRQDLGRSHDRRLGAGIDHRERRGEGDGRLARAHVPLQQAQHRLGPGQVRLDLGDHSPLGAGGLPGQAGPEPLPIEAARDQRRERGGLGPIDAALPQQRELQKKELVEGQATVGRTVTLDQRLKQLFGVFWRVVEHGQGLAHPDQRVLLDQRGRQRIDDLRVRETDQRRPTQAHQGPLPDPLDHRIADRDPQARLRIQDVGVDHAQLAPETLDHPREQHVFTGAHPLPEAAHGVKPLGLQPDLGAVGLVLLDPHRRRVAAAEPPLAKAADHTVDHGRVALLDVGQEHGLAPIFVAQGQEVGEVFDRLEPPRRQLVRGLGPDPREHPDGGLALLRRRPEGLEFSLGGALEPSLPNGRSGTGLRHVFFRRGFFRRGFFRRGLLRRGLLRPGLLRRGLLRPGLLRPGLLRPGFLRRRLLVAGSRDGVPGHRSLGDPRIGDRFHLRSSLVLDGRRLARSTETAPQVRPALARNRLAGALQIVAPSGHAHTQAQPVGHHPASVLAAALFKALDPGPKMLEFDLLRSNISGQQRVDSRPESQSQPLAHDTRELLGGSLAQAAPKVIQRIAVDHHRSTRVGRPGPHCERRAMRGGSRCAWRRELKPIAAHNRRSSSPW